MLMVAACASVAGCAPRPAPPSTVVADSLRAQAMLDAGNQAFRAGDFRLAARRYAAAAVDRPEDPASFYGLGMALAKLGRDEEARVAYAKARELAHRQQP